LKDLDVVKAGLDREDGTLEDGTLGAAWFSPDRKYRFVLERLPPRGWPNVEPWWATWIMLNPSTANAMKDDNTVAKCREFARRRALASEIPLEHVGIRVVNLYAIRATDPNDCFGAPSPIGGALNDAAILAACGDSALVIAAWGADRRSRSRAAEVKRLLARDAISAFRLGAATKDGSPRHPLFVSYSTPFEEMR
jgi:hypothetical protein